jgi:hypothetical protein
MSFAKIGELTIGIFSTAEYNKSVKCLLSAVSEKQIFQCKNITGLTPKTLREKFLAPVF